jgi:hypothetical protein
MCGIWCVWGHIENKCPKPDSLQCMFCVEHLTENHICNVIDCKVGKGMEDVIRKDCLSISICKLPLI